MAVIIESLKDAQLTSVSDSVTYQPSGRTAVVRNIRLANAATVNVPATVNVQCQPGDANRDTDQPPPFRHATAVNLVVPFNGIQIVDEEITLDAGDTLRIALVNANEDTKLDVVVSGIEREL